MSASKEFVEYAAEQLAGAGEITYRKMFGEYGLYCSGKFFACICEDQLFVKITEAGQNTWEGLEKGYPYEGSSAYFLIEELDDRDKLAEFAKATCDALPMPKPRKKKKAADKKDGEA